MRTVTISVDEYYHLLNRGTGKQIIFHDQRDYARFLFLILHLQSPIVFENISRQSEYFVKHSVFNTGTEAADVARQREVELIAFCLMPNHFHLAVRENIEGGISRYMHRILNGYSKYYNAKYEKSGHVFQGPYKAIHQADNDQLLYLSTYIHQNPRELRAWESKTLHYPWSSFQDYVLENRWPDLLSTSLISEQFDTPTAYEKHVLSSPAKDPNTSPQ